MTIAINVNAHTVGTVAYWRSAAPHYGVRTWRSAMDRFARQHGRAVAILASDGAVIVERQPDGSLSRHDIPPGGVHWRRQ